MSNTQAILDQLNGYTGENIWQDVVLGLDGYDESSDVSQSSSSDRFELTDGRVFRFDGQMSRWYEQRVGDES